MTPPVFTRLLGAVAPGAADTWVPVYSSPATGTTVIRDVLLVNASATTIPLVALRLRPGSGGVPYYWFGYWTSLPIGVTHLDLRQAMLPSQTLEVFTQTTTLTCHVTGYVFAA